MTQKNNTKEIITALDEILRFLMNAKAVNIKGLSLDLRKSSLSIEQIIAQTRKE